MKKWKKVLVVLVVVVAILCAWNIYLKYNVSAELYKWETGETWELSKEDAVKAYSILDGHEVEHDYFSAVYTYRINFSDGSWYEFDNESFNCRRAFFMRGCSYLTEEEGNILMEVVANYSEPNPVYHPSYDFDSDQITLFYKGDAGWTKTVIEGDNADRLIAVLNSEKLERLHEGTGVGVTYYLDFMNGTGVTIYESGYAEVNSGVDSAVYEEWILSGDKPSTGDSIGCTILPNGTTDTIEAILAEIK